MYVQLNCVIVDADEANRQELATFLNSMGVNIMAKHLRKTFAGFPKSITYAKWLMEAQALAQAIAEGCRESGCARCLFWRPPSFSRSPKAAPCAPRRRSSSYIPIR